MSTPASKRLTGDPVEDDLNFNIKHWVLNAVPQKPYWPLGTEPDSKVEGAARLLSRYRGNWVKERTIAGNFHVLEKLSRNFSERFVRGCREYYGMIVEEKTFPEGIRYRWNGEYGGTIDDRRMTDEMRAEEEKLLQLRVELQAQKAKLFHAFDQLEARKLSWVNRQKDYNTRMRKHRAKIRSMNRNKMPYYDGYGVDHLPMRLRTNY